MKENPPSQVYENCTEVEIAIYLTKSSCLVQHYIVSIKQIKEENLIYKMDGSWFQFIASAAPRGGKQ